MKASDLLDKFPGERIEEGGGWVVHCPAHRDSRPSLRVAFSDKGNAILKCRTGCATQDVVKAVDLSMRDLFDVELDRESIAAVSASTEPIGPRDRAALAMYVEKCAERLRENGDQAAEAFEYLHRRFGVSRDLAVQLGVGVDPGGDAEPFAWLQLPYRRVPRLVVPFRDADGIARGVQGRDLSGTDAVKWCGPKNPPGAAWSKIGVLDLGTGLDVVIVSEGPGDGLTAAAHGYDAVVVRGASLAGSEALSEMLPFLRGKRVVVAGDGDSAGQGFTDKLAARLAEEGLQVHRLPVPDGEDLSSWREASPDSFAADLAAAVKSAPIVGDEPTPEPTFARPAAPPVQRARFARTDVGNAKRLLDHLGLVRYSPEMGFFLYDGAVWVPDRYDAVRAAAQAVSELIVHEGETLIAMGQGDVGKAVRDWGYDSQNSNRVSAMVRELQVMDGVALNVDRLDAHPDLLAFRNGVVNLRTGKLMRHDPALLLTRKVDVDYDAEAACPTWDYFVDSVFPNRPELGSYVQRLVGYGITGHTVEQCFVVLWGTGSNGKSVFTDTLTNVFRAVTTTTPFSTFEAKPSGGIPNDLAALKGSRLVMASEGEQGKPMAEAVMKRITGSDLISARFMRKEFFEFAPTFLIFLGTNYKPNFKGQDEGLWRRVKLIPWARYFAPHERDHYLTDKLRKEAAGIVAWAVRGAMQWYRDGLNDPAAVVNATREYRETSDALAGFLPGRMIHDPEGRISGTEAYHEYTAWAEEEGLPHRERWTRKTFYQAMEERGVPRVRHSSGQVLKGIRRAMPSEAAEAVRADNGFPAVVASEPPKAPSLDEIPQEETS